MTGIIIFAVLIIAVWAILIATKPTNMEQTNKTMPEQQYSISTPGTEEMETMNTTRPQDKETEVETDTTPSPNTGKDVKKRKSWFFSFVYFVMALLTGLIVRTCLNTPKQSQSRMSDKALIEMAHEYGALTDQDFLNASPSQLQLPLLMVSTKLGLSAVMPTRAVQEELDDLVWIGDEELKSSGYWAVFDIKGNGEAAGIKAYLWVNEQAAKKLKKHISKQFYSPIMYEVNGFAFTFTEKMILLKGELYLLVADGDVVSDKVRGLMYVK